MAAEHVLYWFNLQSTLAVGFSMPQRVVFVYVCTALSSQQAGCVMQGSHVLQVLHAHGACSACVHASLLITVVTVLFVDALMRRRVLNAGAEVPCAVAFDVLQVLQQRRYCMTVLLV
jgi:hypothetical protein